MYCLDVHPESGVYLWHACQFNRQEDKSLSIRTSPMTGPSGLARRHFGYAFIIAASLKLILLDATVRYDQCLSTFEARACLLRAISLSSEYHDLRMLNTDVFWPVFDKSIRTAWECRIILVGSFGDGFDEDDLDWSELRSNAELTADLFAKV